MSKLYSEKLTLTKTINTLEPTVDSLEKELEELEKELSEEREKAAMSVDAILSEEELKIHGPTLLKLHLYRSLGIELVSDKNGNFSKAFIRKCIIFKIISYVVYLEHLQR